MACCRRRTLTSNVNLLSRRLAPSFAHIGRDDHELTEPPNRPPSSPIPSPRRGHASALTSLVVPFGGSRDLGFSLPLGISPCHLRSYSSSHGPSSEIDGVDDVAVVLSDSSVEIASAAAALPPVPVPGEVAAAAADSFLPVAALQHLIDAVHIFSGLNWWASIALTTVLIRVATFPLILNQMKSTVKLNMMRPEIEQIKEQMNSMDPQSVQDGQQQMKALFLKYGVTPFTPMKGLFIQGPIFISFFLAISNMVEKVPSFKGGGAFWFTDLTTPDPQYMLPALAALTFLATVELNMQEGMEGNPMLNTMKNFSRGLALMTVPFTANFPKAIFCYWITSNLFSLAHGLVIRQPPVRKFLNLPDLASQPAAAQPDFSIFGGSKSTAPTASPLSAKESEQTNTPVKRLSTSALITLRIRSLEKAMKARNRLKKR